LAVEPSEDDDVLVGTRDDDTIDALGGNDSVDGAGGNDTLQGGLGVDSLTGGDGSDTLDGGDGADGMDGGAGNDVFYVNNRFDAVADDTHDAGIDEVRTSVSYTLPPGVENLTNIGPFGIDLGGNDLDNYITGSTDFDTIDGGAGADTMVGQIGDDVYYVDDPGDLVVEAAGEGFDTVFAGLASYTLGDNVEQLAGTSAQQTLTGNALNNIILSRGGGDTIIGLGGNDLYYSVEAGDLVVEAAGGGIDEVAIFFLNAYTLPANVENLSCGLGDHILTGNALANSIRGYSGADTLDGGSGNDILAGFSGNDTYIVDSVGDIVVEYATEGVDTVRSSLSYDLGANVENLVLTGAATSNGTGNALDNTITGNGANNILIGGAGADTLRGGAGHDFYIVDNIGDKVLELAGEGDDTVQSSVSYTLGANVEYLELVGAASINGAGNALANNLLGNASSNLLNGGAGADTMNGALGNDTYVVDDIGDKLIENSAAGGNDTVQSSVTFTLGANLERLILTGSGAINGVGNALANVISGNAANNVLNGAAGADVMLGGGGNDVYVVDNLGDRASESSPSGGTDTVQSSVSFTLGNNVENLALTGAGATNANGNALANILSGNGANNLLNGGGGADTMRGGLGNDTYIVDNVGDQALETNAAGGTDIVQSSVSFTLGANVENLTLTGSAAINGTGNTLANVINGNSASNVLDGGTGADTMRGGDGNDIYVVDDIGDTVSESSATGGTETVLSSVSFTLGNNLEKLLLANGAGAINGGGNALANVIAGNDAANALNGLAGNDDLYGRLGADNLSGGTGQDRFFFDTPLGATNVDKILDFSTVDDSMILWNPVFTGLATGPLAAGAFRNGSAAVDADDRILYDSATGALYFDADGSGAGVAVQFATLSSGLALSASDFIVI